MPINTARHLSTTLLIALLTACPDSSDTTKPTTSINTPATDATVTSTTPIQLTAQDDKTISNVRAFARARGSNSKGVPLGSSVKSPYVISWNTNGVPNLAELELYGVAEDAGGNQGSSDPVRVKTQNSGVPNLRAFTAFTYPAQVPTGQGVQSAGAGGVGARDLTSVQSVLPFAFAGIDVQSIELPNQPRLPWTGLEHSNTSAAGRVQTQDLANRSYALEWEWDAFTGADGFGVYRTDQAGDLAGPYNRQANQAAATTGIQKRSSTVVGAKTGDTYFGLVSAITGGRTNETGFSNADSAMFLAPQDSATPAEGSSVTGGRPTLTWTGTPGVVGYLYYVYDKNPWDPSASLKWSNSPKSTDAFSAVYPSGLAALPAGSYYWWVAGVSFDKLGKADGLTFSEPKRFMVP